MPNPEGPPQPKRRNDMTTEQVQRWVISLLVFAISAFPIGGLIAASYSELHNDRRGAAIGLMIMAGVIGVLALSAIRIIHKRSLVTPLLILGVVPASIAAYFIFR